MLLKIVVSNARVVESGGRSISMVFSWIIISSYVIVLILREISLYIFLIYFIYLQIITSNTIKYITQALIMI